MQQNFDIYEGSVVKLSTNSIFLRSKKFSAGRMQWKFAYDAKVPLECHNPSPGADKFRVLLGHHHTLNIRPCLTCIFRYVRNSLSFYASTKKLWEHLNKKSTKLNYVPSNSSWLFFSFFNEK